MVIADDVTAIRARPKERGVVDTTVMSAQKAVKEGPERILMLGWNRRGPSIAYELSRFVLDGSSLHIVADSPPLEAEATRLDGRFSNLAITHQLRDATRGDVLKSLDIPSYDHIIVLGYTDSLSPQSADTRTLVTLLQIRKLTDAAGKYVNVVSEMADSRNRALAEVTRADDFVVSSQLVSLMLAQASENRFLSAIFAELLDERGSEVYIRPVADYVAVNRQVNFHTIVEAARRRGEVAIGYKQAVTDRGERKMGGVVINPPKAEMRTYRAGDGIVVIARE